MNFSTIVNHDRIANGKKRDVPEDLAEKLRLHSLWLDENPFGRCAFIRRRNLSDCLLENARLQGIEAEHCSFAGAIMKGAWLTSADLDFADLQVCDLRRANLIDASLYKANLRYANLSGACLRGADLTGADLRDVNLENADLRKANLNDALLGGIIVDRRTVF